MSNPILFHSLQQNLAEYPGKGGSIERAYLVSLSFFIVSWENKMKKSFVFLGLLLVAGLFLLGGHSAQAANNCAFNTIGDVMILQG
ncbi:MAG: hypothetical protein KC421_30255, partial [Anaerolineales bacterium]|nr:hypothetical protein [Anaerolineales bacterium]